MDDCELGYRELRIARRRKWFLVITLGLTIITGVAGALKTFYAATMNDNEAQHQEANPCRRGRGSRRMSSPASCTTRRAARALASVGTDALFGVGQGLAAGFKAVARRGTSEVDRLLEDASKLQRARGTARRSARVSTVARMEMAVSFLGNSAKRRRLSEAEKGMLGRYKERIATINQRPRWKWEGVPRKHVDLP
ncbi:hypothetical protein H634G_04222 [Metarhizium anisopliae BRIP 53293]|uniref:Uncharacterized protein n=1 Tax=Metarhizium anisopliae BRIP 53293 TaxID=1291518 RepID=A0A0D9P1K4_METAN|nr:hypothetical protein H634G_04222 [Metarhizium anisopliae BRIP 53293]KJK91679.1 hypothetical protein H633G_04424 [Metarhizium anisopliae BRIP 53284]